MVLLDRESGSAWTEEKNFWYRMGFFVAEEDGESYQYKWVQSVTTNPKLADGGCVIYKGDIAVSLKMRERECG